MASFITNLMRSRDLLDAQLEFVDLALDVSDVGRPRLLRTGAKPAIVVRLPPQHLAEAVVSGDSPNQLPYRALLSCPSRIAFSVPDEVTEIPFAIEAIFALLATWEPLLSDSAPNEKPATVIEFPDRLLLVPDAAARFLHPAAPATSEETKRTALWHSRIVTITKPPDPRSRFRVIRNPADSEERPLETTLKKRHRTDIVTRSEQDHANPHVIASARFMLSALGASATLKSAWPPDNKDLLQAWDHDAECGRDRYVRTAERGYLFPFGHRATLVTITQRRFASHFPLVVAELFQEQTLLVEEEEREFTQSAYPSSGREMPFKRIRISSSPRTITEHDPIPFEVTATDRGDNLIACNLIMFFVPAAEATDINKLNTELLMAYKSHQDVDLRNQLVAVADDESRRGDTSLNVQTVKFGVKIGNELREPVHPPFLPVMESAVVRMPALEHLLGTVTGGGPPATTITLHDDYLKAGFLPGEKKGVFAKFAPVPGIQIPAERAGGLAAPQFPALDGLSRTMGPVSGVDEFAGGGSLTPEQLIGDAKLLGQIELKRIIGRVIDEAADSFPLDQLEALYDKIDADSPNPTVFLTRPMMTTVKRGSSAETRFLWKPKLDQGNFPAPLQRGTRDVELILKGRIRKNVASPSSSPGFEVEGKLRNFNLEFSKLLTLEFNALEFRSGEGRKLDVKVDLKSFQFGKDLAFVTEIQNLIPVKSLAGAPVVEPQPDGVVVRYNIPIPGLPLGIFNVQNIALSSSVSLSFIEGKPVALRFALSERNNPFLVSVSIFGGTGFFAVEVRTDGVVQVEAAIEFGGVVSLSLFVIKGGVYVFAGVYVSMKSDGGVLISGHLRFGGYVDVLDLVAVSIEFYIALTYDGTRNVLYGEGSVTVSVKLIFFSESFSFKVTKEVPGFGQAPSETFSPAFADASAATSLIADVSGPSPAMNMSQWKTYCAAFE